MLHLTLWKFDSDNICLDLLRPILWWQHPVAALSVLHQKTRKALRTADEEAKGKRGERR
jgi:hypothetical protein